MRFRRLREDEFDHELLWLFVTLGAAIVGALWLRSGVPTPRCVWHEVTGWPCIGCGGTRCVRLALAGEWAAAFRMNPLAFAGLAGVALYDAYAATVLALRLPRLRFGNWPVWAGWALRGAIAAIAVANWAWLIASGI